MSDSKVLKPEVFPDNAFGFSRSRSRSLLFRIRQVFDDKRKVDAMIVKDGLSGEENLFHALFDKEDVDFEIGIDNHTGWRVQCEISVGNSYFSYILDNGLKASMKALESGGKQLHFLSQKTDDGKMLVAMKAKMNGTSYEEEAVECSRIKFRFSVEHVPTQAELKAAAEAAKKSAAEAKEKMADLRRRQRGRDPRYPPITVQIKAPTGKKHLLEVCGDYTIEMVKLMVQQVDGIRTDQQRLIYDGKQLEDGRLVGSYHIEDGSTLFVVLVLRGGGCSPMHLVSERGVVCFGQKTDQRFGIYNERFIASGIHSLEDLTLELRTKPVFSLAP